jgi:hypothetical protein
MSRYNTKLIRRNNLYPSYGRAQESTITNVPVFYVIAKTMRQYFFIRIYFCTFLFYLFDYRAPNYIDAHINFEFVFLGPMQE